MIVFTHPLCQLEVDGARATVVRYSELLEVVRVVAQKHHLAPELARRFAHALAFDWIANDRVGAVR